MVLKVKGGNLRKQKKAMDICLFTHTFSRLSTDDVPFNATPNL